MLIGSHTKHWAPLLPPSQCIRSGPVCECEWWPIEIISVQCACYLGNAGFPVSVALLSFFLFPPPFSFPLHTTGRSCDHADVKLWRQAEQWVSWELLTNLQLRRGLAGSRQTPLALPHAHSLLLPPSCYTLPLFLFLSSFFLVLSPFSCLLLYLLPLPQTLLREKVLGNGLLRGLNITTKCGKLPVFSLCSLFCVLAASSCFQGINSKFKLDKFQLMMLSVALLWVTYVQKGSCISHEFPDSE